MYISAGFGQVECVARMLPHMPVCTQACVVSLCMFDSRKVCVCTQVQLYMVCTCTVCSWMDITMALCSWGKYMLNPVLISLLYKYIVVTDVCTFISGGGHFGGFQNPLT